MQMRNAVRMNSGGCVAELKQGAAGKQCGCCQTQTTLGCNPLLRTLLHAQPLKDRNMLRSKSACTSLMLIAAEGR